MRERRLHPRVLPRPAEPIKVQLIGDGFVELLRARDISISGLAVTITHEIDVGLMASEIQILLALPGEKAFTAYGNVRHISKERGVFGVQFTRISEDNLVHVSAYVAKRLDEGGVAP